MLLTPASLGGVIAFEGTFHFLRGLTVHGNDVEEATGYRQMVITTMPLLRTLDFTKITSKERMEAGHIMARHGLFKGKKANN